MIHTRRPAYLGAREVDDSRDDGCDDDPEKLEPVKERDTYELRILKVVEWRIEQGNERDEQQQKEPGTSPPLSRGDHDNSPFACYAN